MGYFWLVIQFEVPGKWNSPVNWKFSLFYYIFGLWIIWYHMPFDNMIAICQQTTCSRKWHDQIWRPSEGWTHCEIPLQSRFHDDRSTHYDLQWNHSERPERWALDTGTTAQMPTSMRLPWKPYRGQNAISSQILLSHWFYSQLRMCTRIGLIGCIQTGMLK